MFASRSSGSRLSGGAIAAGLFATAAVGAVSYLGSTFWNQHSLEKKLRPQFLREAYRLADTDNDHNVSRHELRALAIDLEVLERDESVPPRDLVERVRNADLILFRDYLALHDVRLPEGCSEYFCMPAENKVSY